MMSSSLLRTRPSRLRAAGRQLSILVAGASTFALALFVPDALLVGRPVQARAPAPAAAPTDDPAVRNLGAYVGNWVSDKGAHLIVAPSGAVWADGGEMIGSARLDGHDPSLLVFQGASFRCSYRIATEQPDGLVWQVLDETPGAACPEGRYSRHFTF